MPAKSGTPQPSPQSQIRMADLKTAGGRAFHYVPDADTLTGLAGALDLTRLSKVRLEGDIVPAGGNGWDLTANLGATVEQPCVVTFVPVRTRIDTGVERRYRAGLAEPEAGAEQEMPEDDALEPLPGVIDLAAILHEELSLAIPPFPRSPEAESANRVFTEPGKAQMTDEDARPFAALAALRKKDDSAQ